MLIHNVHFWLKEEVSESEKEGFKKGLKELGSTIKEIHQFEVGSPAGTPAREVVDHSFGYSLFIWFKSVEDHNFYQTSPAHDKFVNDFSSLWARVQVFDSVLS